MIEKRSVRAPAPTEAYYGNRYTIIHYYRKQQWVRVLALQLSNTICCTGGAERRRSRIKLPSSSSSTAGVVFFAATLAGFGSGLLLLADLLGGEAEVDLVVVVAAVEPALPFVSFVPAVDLPWPGGFGCSTASSRGMGLSFLPPDRFLSIRSSRSSSSTSSV